MGVKIKICCIASPEEAAMAISEGADALGLVAKMPSGPGPIPDELIASIAATIQPGIESFLLTSEQSSQKVIDHIKRAGTTTVQIVDELTEGKYEHIRTALPWVNIVQVIHVVDKKAIREALRLQDYVDYFLLDSGNPKAAVKTLGGTGNTHNWDISAELVNAVKIPVFLAGGLNAGNVKMGSEKVRPYGVDICSGVRIDGKLHRQKLLEFISAVRSVSN